MDMFNVYFNSTQANLNIDIRLLKISLDLVWTAFFNFKAFFDDLNVQITRPDDQMINY